MLYQRTFTAFSLTLLLAGVVAAQTPKESPAAVAPCNASTPGKPVPCATGDGLAVVNGQVLRAQDLDADARGAVQGLDAELARVRRVALAAHIDDVLLDLAARARKTTAGQLYNAEIASRVVAPTEEQIKEEYAAHPEQYGAIDLAVARDFIAGSLRDRQEKKIFEDWLARQRRKDPVVMGADINAPGLKPGAVLATVGGRKVTLASLDERLKPALYEARRRVYDVQKSALDRAINDLLLKAEAKKRQVTPDDVLRVEITEKVHRPTDEETAKFYQENSWRFKGELPEARPQVVSHMERQHKEQLEKSFYEKLRADATLSLLLAEPAPPVQLLDVVRGPSRGAARAPVTVVVFGDFQCRPCSVMHGIVEEALKPHGDRARVVFREFPMSMHPHAAKAAEAALAAHAQGKFWEYAELLFKNQRALDEASLKKYATEVGIDRARFDAALDGGHFAADVRRDIREGELHGVKATPNFFINGVRLPYSEYHLAGVRKAVEAALARVGQPSKDGQK